MINAGAGRSPPADSPAESDRVAVYRQDGDLLWGEFVGGKARHGTLAGTCGPDGQLEFAYCMVLDSGEVISGRCSSIPSYLEDGRIQLDETWERFGNHASTGTSRLHEIPADPQIPGSTR